MPNPENYKPNPKHDRQQYEAPPRESHKLSQEKLEEINRKLLEIEEGQTVVLNDGRHAKVEEIHDHLGTPLVTLLTEQGERIANIRLSPDTVADIQIK